LNSNCCGQLSWPVLDFSCALHKCMPLTTSVPLDLGVRTSFNTAATIPSPKRAC
jgi:hypothetical protein